MSASTRGQPVAAVTFDLWQTLMHDTVENGRRRGVARAAALQATLAAVGFDRTVEAIAGADQTTWRHCEAVWKSLCEVSIDDQIRHLLAGLAVPASAVGDAATWSRIEVAYVEPFFDHPPTPAPGVHDVLRAVRGLGIRIGLICNTGRTPGSALRRLFDQWGIRGYFDSLAFSNEEGIRKPHPDIFHRELRRLGVTPPEAIHVGDDLVADIAGAKAAGLRAILVGADQPTAPTPPDVHVTSLIGVPEAIARLASA
ncbi:MAG: HAD-IA family hydrolase [Chloroflexi bacterium]|nr:HAD-IA family hydrolase [Chloroflexota bacterium]